MFPSLVANTGEFYPKSVMQFFFEKLFRIARGVLMKPLRELSKLPDSGNFGIFESYSTISICY
jgi:hypothetical protein